MLAVAQSVPNISVGTAGNRGSTRLNIRGTQNGAGGSTANGYYIDELNLSAGRYDFGLNSGIFDVERIEVLRGPQGTLFGRNSIGGAILVTTVKPNDTLSGEVQAGVGSFDYKTGQIIANVPLVEGLLAVRGGVRFEQSDGFIRNVNPAAVKGLNDSNRFDNTSWRLAVRFTPSPSTTIDLSAYQLTENRGLDDLVPVRTTAEEYGRISIPSYPNPTLEDPAVFAGLPGSIAPGVRFFYEGGRTVNLDAPYFSNYKVEIYNARINQVLTDNINLIGVFGYGRANQFYAYDEDFSPLNGARTSWNRELEAFNAELRLQGKVGSKFNWLAGVNYSTEDTREAPYIFSTSAGSVFYSTSAPGTGERFTFESIDKVKSFGVFVNASYSFFDRLTLELAGRFSRDRVESSQEINYTIGQTRPSGPINDINDATGLDFNGANAGRNSYSAFTPRAALTYKLSDHASVYGAISRGYKAGGNRFVTDADGNPVNDFYRQETVWNYEVGFKGNLLDGRLGIEASAFYLDWNDIQLLNFIPNPVVPSVNIEVVDNLPGARLRGFELSLQGRPTKSLLLEANVGYVDSEYQGGPLDGARVIGALPWTVSTAAEYRYTFGKNDAFLRADYSYVDGGVTSIFSASGGLANLVSERSVPSYQVVNLTAGVDLGRFSITARIENLFDERYYTNRVNNAFNLIGSLGDVHPRQWRLTARYKF